MRFPVFNKHLLQFSLVIIVAFSICFNGMGQTYIGTPEANKTEAKDNFTNENYKSAIEEYNLMHRTDSRDAFVNFRLGYSYLQSHEKEKAFPHLELALKDPPNEEVQYWLARAYHVIERFDDALLNYNQYILGSLNKDLMEDAERQIEMCNYAKELIKFPLDVEITNLGSEINSEAPDYYPFVNADETELIFTSRRYAGNNGYEAWDGWKSAEVFLCKEKRGEWDKPKNIGGTINSGFDEEMVGSSLSGEVLFLNRDNMETSGDLSWSVKRGRQFGKAETMDASLNSEFLELTAFITEDLMTIYFASDRPDGFGGFDIYKSNKLPNGLWGTAMNLGPKINTKYDEYFPRLNKDGTAMYFSSKGHTGMGGFDLFQASYNPESDTWNNPKNLGYPINTANDEMQISFTESGKHAYFSSDRKGSLGYTDLWKITFNSAEERNTLILGKVIQKVPIDYNTYTSFKLYQKNGKTGKFPVDISPDTSWVFEDTVTEELQPGYYHNVVLIGIHEGKKMTYMYDKFPKDNSAITVVDCRVQEVPIKGFVKPKDQPEVYHQPVGSSKIQVFGPDGSKPFGIYKPDKESGKYVMILPPGKFKMKVESDGFEKYESGVEILGKGSFQHLIERDIEITPLAPPKALNFKDIPQ